MSPILIGNRAIIFLHNPCNESYQAARALTDRLNHSIVATYGQSQAALNAFNDYDQIHIGPQIDADAFLTTIESVNEEVGIHVIFNNESEFDQYGWRFGRIRGNRLDHFHCHFHPGVPYLDIVNRIYPRGGRHDL